MNGPVPDDLAAELGLAQAAMDPQVDVDDGDGGGAMGAVEAEVEVMADDQPDVPMDNNYTNGRKRGPGRWGLLFRGVTTGGFPRT